MTKLKRARVLKEFTQSQLADMSGVTLYRIQRLEYSWSEPKPDEIKKLCKVFKCQPSELIGVVN